MSIGKIVEPAKCSYEIWAFGKQSVCFAKSSSSVTFWVKNRIKFSMPSCCVPHCTSSQADEIITFHRFPQDSAIRSEWLKRAGMNPGTDVDTTNKRICSAHFIETDFRYLVNGEQENMHCCKTTPVCVTCNNIKSWTYRLTCSALQVLSPRQPKS